MSGKAPAAGAGCLLLFLLPFAAVGVVTGYQAVRFAAAGDWEQAGFMSIFALTFGGVGIGGIVGANVGRRKLAERAALEARHPDAPWLWRSDWAAGRIEDSNRGTMWFAWAFAGFWNLVSLPGAWVALRTVLNGGEKVALVALIFPLVGLGLLVWAVQATLRYRRYGVSVLELRTVPGVVGRSLAGVVRTTSPLHPAGGVDARLTSIRRITRGSGKNRSTSETILWEEARQVSGEPSRTAQGMTTSIPVDFALPRDAAPCDSADPRDRVVWRLRVEASVPGVDYQSTFEVPVFRTAESDLPATAGDLAPESPIPPDYRQPPQSRIQVTTNRRGTEILFPAARNPGAAAGATLFLAIWLGAIGLMLHLGAPILLLAEQLFTLGPRERRVEELALELVAAPVLEELALLVALDAFGHHLDPQAVSEREHRGGDRGGGAVGGQIAHEVAIELDLVDLKVAQIAER